MDFRSQKSDSGPFPICASFCFLIYALVARMASAPVAILLRPRRECSGSPRQWAWQGGPEGVVFFKNDLLLTRQGCRNFLGFLLEKGWAADRHVPPNRSAGSSLCALVVGMG
jgi:hypothetical protein